MSNAGIDRWGLMPVPKEKPLHDGVESETAGNGGMVKAIIQRVSTLFQLAAVGAPAAEKPRWVSPQEKELVDSIGCKKETLVFFERIVSNRTGVLDVAMAKGMDAADISASADYVLDPEATMIWEKRVNDLKREIAEMEWQLEEMRAKQYFPDR